MDSRDTIEKTLRHQRKFLLVIMLSLLVVNLTCNAMTIMAMHELHNMQIETLKAARILGDIVAARRMSP